MGDRSSRLGNVAIGSRKAERPWRFATSAYHLHLRSMLQKGDHRDGVGMNGEDTHVYVYGIIDQHPDPIIDCVHRMHVLVCPVEFDLGF